MKDSREREEKALKNLTGVQDDGVLSDRVQKVYDRAKHLACGLDMGELSDSMMVLLVVMSEMGAKDCEPATIDSFTPTKSLEPYVYNQPTPPNDESTVIDSFVPSESLEPYIANPSPTEDVSLSTKYLPDHLTVGQKVSVSFDNVANRTGIVLGITDRGRIKVEFPNGKIKQVWASRITPEEVSVG